MECKIIIFEGRDARGAIELFEKKVKCAEWYRECDFHNVTEEDRLCLGGEGDIILYTFSRFVLRTIVAAKKSGIKPVVCIEDFISLTDYSVDIYEYVRPLLEVCETVFYFGSESSSLRLRKSGLSVEYYGADVLNNGAELKLGE